MEEIVQQFGSNSCERLVYSSTTTTEVFGASPLRIASPHLLFNNNTQLESKPIDSSPSQVPPPDMDTMKSKILSHPQYSSLLATYLDCQKVGAPPEIAARLSTIGQDMEARLNAPLSCHESPSEPELDQFMEAYREMLVKYKEELTSPMQEATEFFHTMESQLNSLSLRILSSEDQEGSGTETELLATDVRGEDCEMKNNLLKKYSRYLSSLRNELSKKTKKGKLPKDARQQLFKWWEMHYKWPYPSETQKVALAESTGLELKQINNWFINQRKRHWKPTNEMRFAASLYMDGHFSSDGLYRLMP